FVMVKVPPVISWIVNLLPLALVAKSTTAFSISCKDNDSAFLIIGTTRPFGPDTAIETSTKLLYTISSSSILAFTEGHSFKAMHTALVKNDINPKPTPCFSLNLSLYLVRKSIIGFISTSLKVVSIAVSFFTTTKRLAMVFLRDDI